MLWLRGFFKLHMRCGLAGKANKRIKLDKIRHPLHFGAISPRLLRWPGAEPSFGTAFAYLEAFIRTNVYVDGFNFYYGCLRKTPHRWVNVRQMCELLLPKNTVAEIKYFTASVSRMAVRWMNRPAKLVGRAGKGEVGHARCPILVMD